MKKLIIVLGLFLLFPQLAYAQSQRNPCYYPSSSPSSSSGCIPVSSTNPFPVTATATIGGGFTDVATGTPISVTTGGVTGTLPTGTVVVASNVGASNGAYCKLGASATTSDQLIPPNSWFAFTVGAATQLTCITSTSTTTVNMVGGSGLPTGSGGGGGTGGGGAITAASGSYAAGAFSAGAGVDGWDLTQGAKADSVCGTSTGTCSLLALIKFLNTQAASIVTNTGAAIPAGSALIGKVGIDQTTPGTTNHVSQNPYPDGATPYTATATGTTGATTATLAGASSVTTYICGFSIRANATAAATGNATVTGVITATLNFTQWTAPNASGLGVTEEIFSPCIPASGTNQSIAVISAAPGTGGVVSVTAWGYKL